jgi:creatinine amidohydrolase/Fe(II)-dependent formamide hydrolase-like protein
MYCILKSLFLAGINRNIYMIIAHQTEDYNPMELACMKAARKLVFEFLDTTKGYGWWGKNENKEFYQQMSAEDNPWNWVKTIRSFSANAKAMYGGGDHAGKVECSVLESMFPGTIKLERLCETDDWFAQASKDMDVELGRKRIQQSVSDYVAEIKAQKGIQ